MRLFGWLTLTLYLWNLLSEYGECADSKPEFVQIFFRHGQRLPTTYVTFPTDPQGIAKNLPYEGGELTETGMWQEYTLGMNLREDYAFLLDFKYRPSQLRVYTGLDNRTTTSALLALSSFLPPVGDQVWNPALRWQPIPTVTEEIIDHVSFGVFDHCDAFREKLVNSDAYWSIFNSLTNLTKYLETKTGLEIPNLFILQRVVDGIVSRDSIRDLLPFPKWADEKPFVEYLRRNQYKFHVKFMDLFLDDIGGWHYDQILGAMDDFIHQRSKHKVVMYSGHDTNTVTLTQFFKINVGTDILPNFASFISFELHRAGGDRVIKIFFHNKLNQTKRELELRDCPSPCTYDKFTNLGYRRVTTEQWMATCRRGFEENCTFYETLSGIFIVVAVLLVACLVSALWSCISYRKKYNQLNDSETRPLL